MNTTEETTVAEPAVTPPAQSNGDWLFFKKIFVNQGYFVDEKPVHFETLDRNIGVIKISPSNPVAAALLSSAKANILGIIKIDAVTYEDLKKKLPFNPLAQRFKRQVLQAVPDHSSWRKRAEAAVAAVDPKELATDTGVVSVGGGSGGAVEGAGTPPAVPTPPPGEFKPAVGKKNARTSILRKPTGASSSGGIPEPEPTE